MVISQEAIVFIMITICITLAIILKLFGVV